MQSALKWHRRFLQVLQWKAPGKRWALKSPQHMWHLQHIHREYPDALFVQTHRDPVSILVSMSNLAATVVSVQAAINFLGRLYCGNGFNHIEIHRFN